MVVYGDDGKWQKAVIVVVNKNDAFVVFDDTGLDHYVKLEHIRQLVGPFNKIFRKSCKGSLFGYQPTRGQHLWCLQATVMGKNGGNLIVPFYALVGKQFSEMLLRGGFAVKDFRIHGVINAPLVS